MDPECVNNGDPVEHQISMSGNHRLSTGPNSQTEVEATATQVLLNDPQGVRVADSVRKFLSSLKGSGTRLDIQQR